MAIKNVYFVEITDTFGGEANYSWVTRHKVTASNERGAMRKIGREAGMHWRCMGNYGNMQRWDSVSGLTCAFVSQWDDDAHGAYRVNTI